jgi:hypothetical protein
MLDADLGGVLDLGVAAAERGGGAGGVSQRRRLRLAADLGAEATLVRCSRRSPRR